MEGVEGELDRWALWELDSRNQDLESLRSEHNPIGVDCDLQLEAQTVLETAVTKIKLDSTFLI